MGTCQSQDDRQQGKTQQQHCQEYINQNKTIQHHHHHHYYQATQSDRQINQGPRQPYVFQGTNLKNPPFQSNPLLQKTQNQGNNHFMSGTSTNIGSVNYPKTFAQEGSHQFNFKTPKYQRESKQIDNLNHDHYERKTEFISRSTPLAHNHHHHYFINGTASNTNRDPFFNNLPFITGDQLIGRYPSKALNVENANPLGHQYHFISGAASNTNKDPFFINNLPFITSINSDPRNQSKQRIVGKANPSSYHHHHYHFLSGAASNTNRDPFFNNLPFITGDQSINSDPRNQSKQRIVGKANPSSYHHHHYHFLSGAASNTNKDPFFFNNLPFITGDQSINSDPRNQSKQRIVGKANPVEQHHHHHYYIISGANRNKDYSNQVTITGNGGNSSVINKDLPFNPVYPVFIT